MLLLTQLLYNLPLIIRDTSLLVSSGTFHESKLHVINLKIYDIEIVIPQVLYWLCLNLSKLLLII